MARKTRKAAKRRVLRASFDGILEKAAGVIGQYFDLTDWSTDLHTTERGEKRVSFYYQLGDAIDITPRLGRWIDSHLRTIFTRRFRKRTFITLLVLVQHSKSESEPEWRTLSSTLTPSPAFTQAEHNVRTWVVHGGYDACYAFQFTFAYVKDDPKPRKKRKKRTKAKAKH
jgi:hypothetical protein